MACIEGMVIPLKIKLDDETKEAIEWLEKGLIKIDDLEDLRSRIKKIEDFLQLD